MGGESPRADKLSDQDGDPHDSRRGFWYSHFGWLYDHNEATDYGKVEGPRALSS